jgi:WD40 repeat protein
VLADGRLASGSRDYTIRLLGRCAGAESARLEGHAAHINALCLLPDGRLASGAHDNTIRLWDVTNEVERTRLEIDAPVTAIAALGPDLLVAGDLSGRLHWLKLV